MIEVDKFEFLGGVFELAHKGVVPGGSKNNLKFTEPDTNFSGNFPLFKKLMLADAQTSGGLLISVPESKSTDLINLLKQKKVLSSMVIGKIYNPADFSIYVK